MSFETSTPNMSLVLPSVGNTLGPTWAQDINASFAILDQHDHSQGSGVPVTPAGLNISSDLSFQSNNATMLRSARLVSNSGALSLPADLGAVYRVGVDLYYNDGNGTAIRMTQSGGIAGTPGSISGLVSPASVTYNSTVPSFIFQSDTATAADLDAGSLIMRNLTASSKALTLSPPNAMGTDYELVLPSLPASASFVALDTFGNMSTWAPDGTTVAITSNQVVVQTSGLSDNVSLKSIGGNKLAIRNSYMQHQFEINGRYSFLTMPAAGLDMPFFLTYDATILAVWIYNGTPGTSGITEFDLKVASPSGSWTSVLSTTGKIDSTAAAGVWTDSGSVVGSQTGVIKPVIGTTAVNAGQALRFDLIQSMADAADAALIVHYIAR